jgi:hypothetical protein
MRSDMPYMAFIVFMTRAEVIRRYKIPTHLEEELLAAMPVASTHNGKPVYLESQVDAFLKERFPYEPSAIPHDKVPSARPRGGRKVETDHEAMFALELKKHGQSIKEIVSAMKDKWPHRKDSLNPDSVRKTIARYEKRRQRKCGLIR